MNKEEQEYVAYIVELMQIIGPVYSKRMFGGHGVFLNNLMFGLIADNILYFKANRETIVSFKERNLQPFTYTKQDKICTLSYYQAPEETLENSEDMGIWAAQAYAVAVKANNQEGR